MSVLFRFKGDIDEPQVGVLWEFGCTGVMQQQGDVVGYFPKRVALPITGVWEDVDDRDYVAEYVAKLSPVAVGRLLIVPGDAEAQPPQGVISVRIDPGMAFGTGHHETTELALAALERTDLTGLSVLDVGTGSGILAIAAKKLGAARVIGIDSDSVAIRVARENASINGAKLEVSVDTLETWMDAAGEGETASADIVVANLYGTLHRRLAAAYARALRRGGLLLATGIQTAETNEVCSALGAHFDIEATPSKGDWALVAAHRQDAAF